MDLSQSIEATVTPGAAEGTCSLPSRTWLPRQERVDLFQQLDELDLLGVVVVATRSEGPFMVARHRMGSQCDHRDSGGEWIGFELTRSLPSADNRKAQIKQDQI